MPRRHLSLRVQDEPAGRALRAGFARIRAELELPGEFPADVLAEAEAAAAAPTLPAVRRDGPAVPHHRPARVDGPGPGHAPRAARRGLPGALRDRRRGRLRAARAARSTPRRTGGWRRSTARTRAPRCTRRSCPRGLRRCCPTRSGRPCCGRWTWTPTASRPLSTYAGPLVRSRDRLDYAERAGPGGRRQGRRAAAAARRGRQAADGPRGRARWGQPADPGAGGRRGRRDVRAGVPGRPARWSRGTSRSR